LTVPLAGAVLIPAWLLAAPAAHAQAQPPSPEVAKPLSNISEEKLNAAAAALQRVASLKQDYRQRLAEAPPADKERIAKEATGALAKAVTDQGLSVEEYTSILKVAESDPQVRDKIIQRLPGTTK
jgi:hypothetical protein